MLNFHELQTVFENHAFDAVIHFAGFKAVGESVAKPLEYYRNNVGGTLNLCRLMSKYGVYKLVFSSSATVYGENAESPVAESAPLGPANPYGRSKYMIEMILKDLAASDPSFNIALLRYFNPVGAHESGWIGEDPKDTPNNIRPTPNWAGGQPGTSATCAPTPGDGSPEIQGGMRMRQYDAKRFAQEWIFRKGNGMVSSVFRNPCNLRNLWIIET